MYIESEFALLEAQNEQLTRENKKLAEALEAIGSGRVRMKQWVEKYAEDKSPSVTYMFSDSSLRSLIARQALAKAKK